MGRKLCHKNVQLPAVELAEQVSCGARRGAKRRACNPAVESSLNASHFGPKIRKIIFENSSVYIIFEKPAHWAKNSINMQKYWIMFLFIFSLDFRPSVSQRASVHQWIFFSQGGLGLSDDTNLPFWRNPKFHRASFCSFLKHVFTEPSSSGPSHRSITNASGHGASWLPIPILSFSDCEKDWERICVNLDGIYLGVMLNMIPEYLLSTYYVCSLK